MTSEEIIKAIAENDQRARSNSRRIEALEKNDELLHKMVTALEVLATQQKDVAIRIEKIDAKVTRIQESPLKRFYAVIGYIVAALCSAIAGALFSGGIDFKF